MNQKPFIITIDGPGGVGKSSLASMLAQELNIPMLDTGAMYRTLGHFLGAEAMDTDENTLELKARTFAFTLDNNTAAAHLLCNGQNINELPIRSPRSTRLSSLVAQLPVIRKVLQENQQNIARSFSIIVEGRDMGTKVFPKAQCKFFLDASPEIRAKRRFEELTQKGEQADYNQIYQDLITRDTADRTRPVDPLKPAVDACIVDTSHFDIHEVFHQLLHRIKEAQQKAKVAEKQEAEKVFTHLDKDGHGCMVDVGHKQSTERKAIVACEVSMSKETLSLLRDKALPKGDVLNTAKVAGILAAKQTGLLIPMCHPLSISYADIRFSIDEEKSLVVIEAEVRTTDRTGVEMEAMVAAQIAAATIYDMCKAVQKDICINRCRLIYKSGGKSGIVEFV